MKYVKLHEWTPKQFFEPHIDHKNSPIGPQKVKTTPKLSQNQKSELNETKKIKVVALYELTPKQFEPDHNPQIAYFLPQNPKNYS